MKFILLILLTASCMSPYFHDGKKIILYNSSLVNTGKIYIKDFDNFYYKDVKMYNKKCIYRKSDTIPIHDFNVSFMIKNGMIDTDRIVLWYWKYNAISKMIRDQKGLYIFRVDFFSESNDSLLFRFEKKSGGI